MTAENRISRMIESQRQAYLEALDIPVWTLRKPTHQETPIVETSETLKLGPGKGGILLICAVDSDPANKIANDIARTLGSPPVWSWPDDNDRAVTPLEAVDNNLFTSVAVFGLELAEQIFGRQLPASLGSANLILLPSMRDLQTQAEARCVLWKDLCRSGMLS